ncbi:TPA: hypothetical protein H1005_03085 [archaeon]|uniref:Uncharacterized protein n=1 Tax=Candidatus Naiadarchaeum limnaeum TaxID=2756139 RepID=A0A832V673_9ARCH|nr:hypothetical protein [Candidatus Naiadarchaeales archaeon SRR2090153.bin1042]HIK00975.1 hypothetical protein [Candidatus Naiadarchaeum limnaeum]
MTTRTERKIVIQAAIVLAFVFSLVVAYIAWQTGSLLMGLIFLTALQIIVLLAILFVLESLLEITETRL